jgi:hypothetical protein
METFLHLSLLVLALIAWRIAFVLRRPFGPHRWCGGKGCKRCGGSGQKRRLGAGRVSRAYQTMLSAIAARFGGDS